MSKKALLTASVLLVLVTPAPVPAHRLDGPDIVYMDVLPCNAACQSYMAWSRQQTGQPQPRHTERPSRKEARATRRAIAHRHPPHTPCRRGARRQARAGATGRAED